MRRILAVCATAVFCQLVACGQAPTVSSQSPNSKTNEVNRSKVDAKGDPPAPTSDKVKKPDQPTHGQKQGDVGHRARKHASHGSAHGRKKHQSRLNASKTVNAHRKHLRVGHKVPDFEVSINGKTVKLSELRKHQSVAKDAALVLTFWCSFCHSCRDVEGKLNDLAKSYKGKVAVLALDASAGETTKVVGEFANKKGLTFPIGLDSKGLTADIFGATKTTTTVVIDGQNRLRYWGQFADRRHLFAEEALKAVLSDKEVSVKRTRQKG